MDATQGYEILNSLKQKTSPIINVGQAEDLSEKGLALILTSSEYRVQKQEVEKIARIEAEMGEYSDQITEAHNQRTNLQKKMDSKWHRFWTSKKNADKENAKMDALDKSVARATTKQAELLEEKNLLQAVQQDLKGYVLIPEKHVVSTKYIALTELGKNRAEQIRARLTRLEGIGFEEALQEITTAENVLSAKYERFEEFYRELLNKKLDASPELEDFALSLSEEKGQFKEVYQRALELDKELEKAFREEFGYSREQPGRLRTLSELLRSNNSSRNSVEELAKLFRLAMDNNHANNYGTFFEQALCLEIPLETAQKRWDRYDLMGDVLSTRGWVKNKESSCYVAANLSQREGETVSLAGEFRSLEQALVDNGIKDCRESGYAALVLLDDPGKIGERIKRFGDVLETMKEYEWEIQPTHYGSAATITLMPGTIEENVQNLNYLYEKITEGGFTNTTHKAAQILNGIRTPSPNKERTSSGANSIRRRRGSDYPTGTSTLL